VALSFEGLKKQAQSLGNF